MSRWKALWRSVRPGNLLIIGATFAIIWTLMRTAFERPIFGFDKINSLDSGFFLIVISIILIAAAGNLLNDFLDIEADKINRPYKNLTPLLGRAAPRLYLVLTALGIVIGIQASLKLGDSLFILYPVATSALLYLYSKKLQRSPLIGNLCIALLCASIPFVTYGWFLLSYKSVFLPPNFYQNGALENIVSHLENNAFYVSLFYGSSAFTLNLSREIVKDIEDNDGDEKVGHKTLLNTIGMKSSKRLLLVLNVLYLLIVLTAILAVERVFGWGFDLVEYLYSFSNIRPNRLIFLLSSMVLLILPGLINLYLTSHLSKQNAHRASLVLKITMLLGLSTCLFFWFL